MNNRRDHRHFTASAVTVAVHAALLLILLSLFLRYDRTSEEAREWPPVDSAEILFGGEYVMAGDIPEEGHNDAPAPPEVQPEPSTAASATPAEPAPDPTPEPVITSKQPSPAKAQPDAEARRKAAQEKAEADRRKAEQERRDQQAAAINSRVSFGNATGKSGQTDGNSATGAVSGVSASGLGNRTAITLPQPPKGPMGKIVITIKVDRQGNVTSASYLSGSGAAAASADARSQCLAAARKARFSPLADAPATQTGTLTYVYK
ncbi:MAG: TonB family protein [Bacteroides sp.]|nr:TonB family protein [Bacteroides sp.]